MSRARDLADFIGSGSTLGGILAGGVIDFVKYHRNLQQ